MAAYTEHYHLHQWEPEDSFLRTDFNGDLSAIDAALLGLERDKCRAAIGRYTGDGELSLHGIAGRKTQAGCGGQHFILFLRL